MDVWAHPSSGEVWHLEDLLQRPLGTIVKTQRGFDIHPSDGLLSNVDKGPFETLALAMLAVEKRVRGACRISDHEPGP